MDSHYDIRGAADRLEHLALERYNSEHSGLQLSRIASVTSRYEAVSVGTGWRLAHKSASEEVVGCFQGVIYKKDLPPFVDKLSGASNHVRHLRQSVTIAGLNTKTFDKVLNAVLDVHGVLSRAVGISKVQDCGMVASHNGTQLVELSNRYFTPKSASVSNEDEMLLPSDIDPHGYLAQAASSAGLYHSSDNSVDYFEREGTNDEYKYQSVKPVIFNVGDIVEVQGSFVVYPLRGGKLKTAMVLRGITLIDGTFTQARIRSLLKAKPCVGPSVSLKRKSFYQEEQLSVTNTKLIRMEIDVHHAKECKVTSTESSEDLSVGTSALN